MIRKFNTFYCMAIVASLCVFSQDADAGGKRLVSSSFSPAARIANKIRVAPHVPRATSEPGLPGVTIYLDINHNTPAVTGGTLGADSVMTTEKSATKRHPAVRGK
jgi:hypothetical protein